MKGTDTLYYRNPNAAFPTWKKVRFEMRISQGEIKLSEGTTFDLRDSVMRWVGVKHHKTCILLEEPKKKGKVYLIGSEVEEEVKALHDKIRAFILESNSKESKNTGANPEDDPKPKNLRTSINIKNEEEEEDDMSVESKLPELFAQQEYMLNPAFLLTEDDYENVFASDTFRISQNKFNKQTFKFNVTLDVPVDILLKTLQDYSAAKKWNAVVSEAGLYQKINSKSYVIIKEERKLASKLFSYSREFIFARIFYSASGKAPFFMLEKSVDVSQESETTRGTLKKAVYMIRSSTYNKGTSIIAGEVEVSNNGLINASTDSWLTIEYLKQFMSIEQYVSESQGIGSFQEIEKAFDLESLPQQGEELPNEEFKVKDFQQHNLNLTEEQAQQLISDVESNKHSQMAISKKFVLTPTTNEISGVRKNIPLDISKGWERNSNGVEFVDYELIKTQHKILGFLLKKMGRNLLMGKSILGVSLPVEIFDNKSVLGRIAEKFLYAPKCFDSLNGNSSKEEIAANVFSFLLTTLVIGIEQHKPFNPILGETYQGWIDGCPLYMEQTFHHPPISSFIMYGKNFKFYGSIEFTASLHVNSASARQLGVCSLEILDCKKVVNFIFPIWNVNGTTFGKRCMVIEGKSYIAIPSSNTLIDLQFNPNKKGVLGGFFGGKDKDSDPNASREDFFQLNASFLNSDAYVKAWSS